MKTDDSSSENSPSASTSTANEETDNSQLSEISAKLSIIISAINELSLTASIKETNICSASVSNEATISEISKLIKNIDESVTKRTNPEMHMDNVEMQDASRTNFLEAEAMRIRSRLSQLWEKKLIQRRDAYWAFVRNSENLEFHKNGWRKEGRL